MSNQTKTESNIGKICSYIALALGALVIIQAFIVGSNISPNFEYSLYIGVAIFVMGVLFRIISKHLLIIGIIQILLAISCIAIMANLPGTMDYLIVDFILMGTAIILLIIGIVALVKYFRLKSV